MVERVERGDAAIAQRLELETLLDEFVRMAMRHQRCLDAQRPIHVPPGGESVLSARRRELIARRNRCRDECECHAKRLAQELDELEELVRLVDQKLACPPDEAGRDAEIERRLWELDEVDSALRQLSA